MRIEESGGGAARRRASSALEAGSIVQRLLSGAFLNKWGAAGRVGVGVGGRAMWGSAACLPQAAAAVETRSHIPSGITPKHTSLPQPCACWQPGPWCWIQPPLFHGHSPAKEPATTEASPAGVQRSSNWRPAVQTTRMEALAQHSNPHGRGPSGPPPTWGAPLLAERVTRQPLQTARAPAPPRPLYQPCTPPHPPAPPTWCPPLLQELVAQQPLHDGAAAAGCCTSRGGQQVHDAEIDHGPDHQGCKHKVELVKAPVGAAGHVSDDGGADADDLAVRRSSARMHKRGRSGQA